MRTPDALPPSQSSLSDPAREDGPRVLAVLPLEHFTEDPEETRLATFICRNMVTRLSVYRDIQILAPGTSPRVRAAATPLKAHYYVEGRVMFGTAEVAITVQLTDAITGTHIWADRYTLAADRAFGCADDMAASIVGAIIPMVTTYEYHRDRHVPDDDLTATGCLYRGRYLMRSTSLEAQTNAIELFERSIFQNPRSGAAHAALASALCHCADLSEDHDAIATLYERAKKSALDALELEPDLAPGWYMLARCLIAAGELEDAVHAAESAVRLNELSVRAQYTLGQAQLQLSQADEALASFDAALRISSTDSLRGAVMANRACALLLLRRYDEAIDSSRQAQREPDSGAFSFLGEICGLVKLERLDEVPEAFDRARAAAGGFGLSSIPSLNSNGNDFVKSEVVDPLKLAEQVWQKRSGNQAVSRVG